MNIEKIKYYGIALNRHNLIYELNKKQIKNYEVVSGVNGKKININLLDKKFINFELRHIGCFLAHIKVFERIINDKSDNDYYVILEEDAKFCDDYTDKLKDLFYQINKYNIKFDILYLGSFNYIGLASRLAPNVYRSNYPVCVHGYLLRKETAKYILDVYYELSEINDVIDHFLAKLPLQKVVCYKNIIFQGDWLLEESVRNGDSKINCPIANSHNSW